MGRTASVPVRGSALATSRALEIRVVKVLSVAGVTVSVADWAISNRSPQTSYSWVVAPGGHYLRPHG